MTTPMTEERLKEIEARCEAATPGPWKHNVIVVHGHPLPGVIDAAGREICSMQEEKITDAAFCAHARQDVPELLAEVRRLQEENRELYDNIAGRLNRQFVDKLRRMDII